MLEITSSQIQEFCQTSTELVAKISNIQFDINTVRTDILSIINDVPPIAKDGNAGLYTSVGLQYLDAANPYYDSVRGIFYVDDTHTLRLNSSSTKLWTKWNDLDDRVSYLKDPIYNLGLELYRTRILQAHPGMQSVKHIDYDWKYHIPVTTNTDSFLDYSGTRVHLPANGSAYIVNAGFMHTFNNLGTDMRIHYCGILNIANPGDRVVDINPIA